MTRSDHRAENVTAGSAAQVLGRFVVDSDWKNVTAELRHEAKRSLLNFFGGALGVARTEPIEAAVRVLRQVSGPGQAALIGRVERFDMLNAAFINAISANLLDYDDTHLNTVIHPTAPVAPAALALAEHLGLPGSHVLHAFILGAEVECRIGNAVSPGHYARGWHITSTCGVFGSTAASAKLLGLTAEQTAHALGIAASQSAGIVENLPSAAKNVSVGNAARNGLFAALLAGQGYTAAPASIEGKLGWAQAMGDVPEVGQITGGLGCDWEFLKNTYKPYPCGIVLHSVIDACLALREQHGLAAAHIAEVIVKGHKLLLARGDRTVANERDARVSIHHSAAVAFLYGAAGMREYSSEFAMRPEVIGFRGIVRAMIDADMPVGAATVVVRTTDGRTISSNVAHAKGSVELPLTDREIEAKVRDLSRQSMAGCDSEAIIAKVWQIDTAPDLHDLMSLVHPATD